MEMSWYALLPTIVAVVVLAALILTRSEKPRTVADTQEKAGDGRASTLFPSLVPWVDAARMLREKRQRVWPIDKVASEAQARRGMIVAAGMAILALLAFVGNGNSGVFSPGLAFLLSVIPFAGIGMLFGALHAIIVRLMPYRGPIVSTVIGGLIGFATMLATDNSPSPNRTLIYAGALYGLIVGVIELAMPPAKTRRPPSARSLTKARGRP